MVQSSDMCLRFHGSACVFIADLHPRLCSCFANACKQPSLDVGEAREALAIWCSLEVMKYNPVQSKIKLVEGLKKYTSLKEHKKKKVASKISVPSLFGVADTIAVQS